MTGDLIEHKVAEFIETILQNRNFDESSTKKYHFVFHYLLVILSIWLAPRSSYHSDLFTNRINFLL